MSKRSGKSLFARLAFSDLLLLATSAHLSVGILTHILWLLRGDGKLFRYYFGYEDTVFLVLCTILEFSWAYLAWKQFSPGQLLRRAWLLIMISALCHVVGMVVSHILCADSSLNPIYVFDGSRYHSVAAILLPIGTFLGGPLHMVILAGGLFLALRLYRKFGFSAKLKGIDWILLAISVAYALHVAYTLVSLCLGARSPRHLIDAMNWANDPLLSVLLFFAIFLRRSVAQMGSGYVSRCWGAYVVAIFGTSLSSLGAWATNFGVFPYPERAIIWYIWPLIYASFALGPIYQVEVTRIAERRLELSTPSR